MFDRCDGSAVAGALVLGRRADLTRASSEPTIAVPDIRAVPQKDCRQRHGSRDHAAVAVPNRECLAALVRLRLLVGTAVSGTAPALRGGATLSARNSCLHAQPRGESDERTAGLHEAASVRGLVGPARRGPLLPDEVRTVKLKAFLGRGARGDQPARARGVALTTIPATR